MHSIDIESVFKKLTTDHNGLSSREAHQRLTKKGYNELKKARPPSKWILFLKQFSDMMIIVLCIAAVVSGIIGFIAKSTSELFDALIVLAIIFLNAIIGFIQEIKAEDAVNSLKKMTQPYSKVLRDGQIVKIKSAEVVVGDIVVLEAGDLVPADIRLFECYNLKISESALTGESSAISKTTNALPTDLAIADRTNMAFSGGVIEVGRGMGVVCSVGMDTEIGKIAGLLNERKQEDTLLQKKLNKTAQIITIVCLCFSFLIFIVSIFLKMGLIPAFMTSVAIAVAAIPEGLPAIITIIMAIGVQRLSKKRAIVKRLRAVETLGCTQVICSDKTGTLTLNKLVVKDELLFNKERTFACALNCNNAQLGKNAFGDSIEIALLDFIQSHNSALNKLKRLNENPFDSERKKMSVVCQEGSEKIVFCKGAPDIILKDCKFICEQDHVIKITPKHIQMVQQQIKEFGDQSYKVLGFAYKPLDDEENEQNLIFTGLFALQDPPRKDAKYAIQKCKEAGIKVVMITGDHKSTAVAIARQLNLIDDEEQTLTGAELDALSDANLESKLDKINVFARVSPQHKVRIVKAFKNLGKIVAMTGDGVNDAPSLKEADIGIGMGESGTEVAQSVSDIVLADDNFATIVTSVEEGRKIYSNITKTVAFLLSANIAEMLSLLLITIFVAPFFGVGLVFLIPAQILFINLITDALPAIALGIEPLEKNAMKKPPRKESKHLLYGRTGINIIYQGLVQTIIVIGVFLIGLINFDNMTASTMALLTLNFIQLFHCFNCKNEEQSIFKKGLFGNKILCLSFILGVIFTVLICTFSPLMIAFGTVKMNLHCWLISILGAFLIVPIVEIVKYIQRKNRNKKTT